MKILLLSPKIDAEHQFAHYLRTRGMALLFPDDAKDAWQMLQLHGKSIDLAVLHIEELSGNEKPTLDLVKKIKSDPSQSDLPILLTTDRWTDEQCATHQSGPEGANAYLVWPFTEESLYSLIQAVLGQPETPALTLSKFNLNPPSDPLSFSQAPPAQELESPLENPVEDPESIQEMPYLFKKAAFSQKNENIPSSTAAAASHFIFSEPVGNAVIPGGAAQTPDLETFKKYLLLREQDVAVLSNQLKAAHEQISAFEKQLRDEKSKNSELTHRIHEQKERIEQFNEEKGQSLEVQQQEISELRFQAKNKTDKAKALEIQLLEAHQEMENFKERVRSDIRKIRVREKELENRLEITKKDSEALLGARETKIIELKRRIDLLEFNMDLLQDKYSREKENAVKLKERLTKAAQVVRVAGGLLDSNPEGNLSRELENLTQNKDEPKPS